jgi:uncharacterized protein (TIGR03067 family)
MLQSALVFISALATFLEPVQSDPGLDAFQGTWRMLRDHSLKRDMAGVKDKWIIKGDHLTVDSLREDQGVFKFDSDVTPNRFTKAFDNSRDNLTVKGTYRLDGDLLIFYSPLSPRVSEAQDLPATPSPGFGLDKWKRVGGMSEDFNGEWRLIERVFAGNRQMPVFDMRLKISNTRWTSSSRIRREYEIKIDHNNRFIDLIRRDADVLSTDARVYKFNAGRLTVWQERGNRPIEVSDAPDSDNRFQVFEKETQP